MNHISLTFLSHKLFGDAFLTINPNQAFILKRRLIPEAKQLLKRIWKVCPERIHDWALQSGTGCAIWILWRWLFDDTITGPISWLTPEKCRSAFTLFWERKGNALTGVSQAPVSSSVRGRISPATCLGLPKNSELQAGHVLPLVTASSRDCVRTSMTSGQAHCWWHLTQWDCRSTLLLSPC